MSKATKYLLTTEVQFNKTDSSKIVAKWKKSISSKTNIYLSENEESLLEIRAMDGFSELPELLNKDRVDNLKSEIGNLLKSDFHQELLTFKEDVISQTESLPTGEFLQLRHIEVPLNVYDEYLKWRENTIFKHVKQLKTVESFVAYHSVLSMQPGVMFLSSFSCDIESYVAGFTNAAYQEIVKQAGDRFITGGKNGLYTKIYKKV